MLPNSVSCWAENVPSHVIVPFQLCFEMSVVSQIATIVTTSLSLKSSSFTGIDGPHLQALVQLCQKGPVGKWDIQGVLPVPLQVNAFFTLNYSPPRTLLFLQTRGGIFQLCWSFTSQVSNLAICTSPDGRYCNLTIGYVLLYT